MPRLWYQLKSQPSGEKTGALGVTRAGPSPEVTCLQRERERSLSMALSELTPALREAIELRELRELSLEETARALGISVPAVKGRVFHGRRKLRKMLHPNDELARQRGRQVADGIRLG